MVLPSLPGRLASLNGGPQRSAGGDAHQHAFAAAHFLTQRKGVIVLHRDDLIIDLGIQYLRHEACADALDLVGAGHAGGENSGALGLHGYHLHLRIPGLQILRPHR